MSDIFLHAKVLNHTIVRDIHIVQSFLITRYLFYDSWSGVVYIDLIRNIQTKILQLFDTPKQSILHPSGAMLSPLSYGVVAGN